MIALVDILSFTILVPLLPFYVLSLGASPFVIGALLSIFGLCQFLSGPILGSLSDRWGRRPVLMLSQLGTFFGLLLLAYARSLPLVFLARILDGVTSGNITVAQAYVADTTPLEARTPHLRSFRLGLSRPECSWGPALSAFLARYGTSVPILAAGRAWRAEPDYDLALHCPPHPRSRARSPPRFLYPSFPCPPLLVPLLSAPPPLLLRTPFPSPDFYSTALPEFCVHDFSLGYRALLAAHASDGKAIPSVPKKQVMFSPTAVFLSLAIQSRLIGPLVKRLGGTSAPRGGLLIATGAGFAMLGCTSFLPALAVALSLYPIGNAILMPTLMSRASQASPPGQEGAVMGILHAIQAASQIFAPLVSGLLIGRGFFSGWAWMSAAICLGGFLCTLQNAPKIFRARKELCPYPIG